MLPAWEVVGTRSTAAVAKYTVNFRYRVAAGDVLWLDRQAGLGVGDAQVRTPQDRLKEILRDRHAPAVITTRKPAALAEDERERRARGTLRRVLGEQKFRNFIKCGFVSVKARSGRVYQVFPGHGITCVYEGETMVERLCVVLTGNFPPTDSLIVRYLMILNNEQQFCGLAVKHGVGGLQRRQPVAPDARPLPDIYKELKGGVLVGPKVPAPVAAAEKVA
jgi:hypothetical protein